MPRVTQINWVDRQAGDIGCLHHKGKISDLIIEGERLAGEIRGAFTASHCYVVANNAILEAIYPKISLSPWNVYDGQDTVLFRIDIDPVLKQSALLEIVHEYVGRGYDVTGCALGMAYVEIMRALCIPAENNIFASHHKEWYSELGTRYIQKLIPDSLRPTSTDPQQVYNYMESLIATPYLP